MLSILDDTAQVKYTYELDAPLTDKIDAVAKKIYRAGSVSYSAAAKKTLDELTALGYGCLPVCIAKTQYSFSDNAKLTGAPEGFPSTSARCGSPPVRALWSLSAAAS